MTQIPLSSITTKSNKF